MRTVWNLNDAAATALIEQGATVAEVAERLGVTRQAVNHAIRRGRIPAPSTRLGDSPLARPEATPPDAACAGTSPTQG